MNTEEEDVKDARWEVAPHPITGRWRIVTPTWEMTPIGGAITHALSRTICERVVAAVWGDGETVEERLWRTRAAANHEALVKADAEHARRVGDLLEANNRYLEEGRAARRRVAELERKLAEAKERAEYLDGVLADISHERDTLVQERDSALAVIDMVNRSANAWAKGCDRAERTITRLKARIARLKPSRRAA